MRILIAVLLVLASPLPALSQDGLGPELGELHLSFDPVQRVTTADQVPFDQFQFHVLASLDWGDVGLPGLNGFNGLRGWEASVVVPPELTVVGREILPATSIDIGNGGDNYVVGTGKLVDASGDPAVLVVYTGLLTSPGLTDLVVSLGGSQPSSFDDPGGPGVVPGWLEFYVSGQCGDLRCLRPFADASSRLVINCQASPECAVAVVRRSWGSVKAGF